MQSYPWKEAASLIIVARASVSEKVGRNMPKSVVVSTKVTQQSQPKGTITKTCDYRIMMVKRSGLSSFMASAYVFPGGKVEVADYSPQWWRVFERMGIKKQLNSFANNIHGPRPPMVIEPQTLSEVRRNADEEMEFLPSDVALRIAAIRETFEETGVLLLTHPPTDSSDNKPRVPFSDRDDVRVDLGLWRSKVREDASAFMELCLEVDLCPDLWSLYEWCDWLTPISIGHKRFDTMFYVCCLEMEPTVVLDNSEVTTLKWCTPMDMLDEHAQEKVFLPPPQVYELSRIQLLPNFNKLKEFTINRESNGVERWLPVLSTYTDGTLSLLPGDDYYPKDPDIIGKEPIPDYPTLSLEDMRNQSKNINRIELRGPICTVLCNTKLFCGHLTPITYPTVTPVIQSML